MVTMQAGVDSAGAVYAKLKLHQRKNRWARGCPAGSVLTDLAADMENTWAVAQWWSA